MDHAQLSDRLHRAVMRLCPQINQRLCKIGDGVWTEEDLLVELVFCILSSQVPFRLARAATQMVRDGGFLDIVCKALDNCDYEFRLYTLLSSPMEVGSRSYRYRFPLVRARQISTTLNVFRDHKVSLKTLTMAGSDAKSMRKSLVSLVCGMGPKQASMFLRNIGSSSELAILDRHVLRYMAIQNMIEPSTSYSLSFRQYEWAELIMERYAQSLGYPVGCVDYAIWISMKAAQEVYSNVHC